MRDDKLLGKIAGLLRQAEGTDNEHEAQAFLAAAQRLATAASIDLALARAHDPARRAAATPITRQVTIGAAGKRGLRTYVELFTAIARPNDVTCDVASNSTFVLAYGFEADIDTVEALYTSLVVQMVAASDAYLKSGAYRDQTAKQQVTRTVGRWRYRTVEEKPLAPVTARLNFQTAFAERIGARLQDARDQAQHESVAAEREVDSAQAPSTATVDGVPRRRGSTALALRDKQREVADYYRGESAARGTWRPGRAGAGYSDAARRAGDRAGARAKIGDDRAFGAPRGAIDA